MEINYFMIGERIRQYREKKGLSQEDLADIINATERHLRNIEAGRKGPSVSLLISLANALDVSSDDLLLIHML
jgi:transcriptional regulator with XRE-family HTH domain